MHIRVSLFSFAWICTNEQFLKSVFFPCKTTPHFSSFLVLFAKRYLTIIINHFINCFIFFLCSLAPNVLIFNPCTIILQLNMHAAVLTRWCTISKRILVKYTNLCKEVTLLTHSHVVSLDAVHIRWFPARWNSCTCAWDGHGSWRTNYVALSEPMQLSYKLSTILRQI